MSDIAVAPASTSGQNGSSPSDPSEVGWQFVPQYYTFINKQPDRLHCFYKKGSTFIHGTEGEDGQACHGQHQIHEKIMSMGLEDCKVFIHSVDAQASAENGIIIQVIGEMSNRNEAWRKFVQTFFLAEQPKGYYILNDIFRYLKEESVEDEEVIEGEEIEETEPVQQQEQDVSLPTPVEVPHPQPLATEILEEPQETVQEPTPAPSPPPVQEEPPITKPPQVNGVHEEPAKESDEPSVEAPTVPEPEPVQESAPAPVQASPAPAPAQAAQPALPVAAEKPAQTPPQEQKKPIEDEQPKGPRTWANLAAANSKKWSSNLATESRGMSVEAAPAPTPVAASSRTPVQAPVLIPPQSGGAPQSHAGPRNVRDTANSLTRGEVFVKGLVDPMSNADLETLLSKFGKIKNKEFVRQRAIAFFEFEELEAAKTAIIESGNVGAGGKGGIFWIPPNGGDRIRIVVDVKREKGDKDRPPARPRQGGVPNQPSSDRGGMRGGRGAARGGGRPIPAGGK